MPTAIIPKDDDPNTPILTLDAFPPTGEPKHKKLTSWDLFASMGSPKYVVAPMVDQSELAWRILSRRHGAQLVYTPMINSRRFSQMTASHGPEHDVDFWIAKDKALQEEGAKSIDYKPGESSTEGMKMDRNDTDEPVIVQFCGNDPELLLQSAKIVEPYCQAVDLNLGCPQHIAKRGHYGSFLQSDWQLIFRLINTLHINLRVPVTAKMRVFDCVDRTVAYAQMLERAGAQIITVHGRTREMKGHNTGLADWQKIKAVKKAVKVPVLANGNVLYNEDIQRALDVTGADGVMSAEGNLYNPTIFAKAPSSPTDLFPLAPTFPFPRLVNLAREYLDICQNLHTPTAGSAIKAHLFRLARPALEVHRDLRPMLGQSSLDLKATGKARFKAFYAFVDRLADLLEADEKSSEYASKIADAQARQRDHTHSWQAAIGGDDPEYVPHWLAQPYYRKAMPPKEEVSEEAEARKEKRKLRLEQTGLKQKENIVSNSDGLTTINDIQTRDEEKTMDSDKIALDAESNKRVRDDYTNAQQLKEEANTLFEKSNYDEAILKYTDALSSLPPRPKTKKEDEDENDTSEVDVDQKEEGEMQDESLVQVQKLRSIIYANIAACHSKLDQHKETVKACNESLKDDPSYVKALHRRAQANEQIGTWSSLSSAMEDYKAIQILPHPTSLNHSLHTSIARLQPKIEERSLREKEEMMQKLKGVGDSVLGWFGLSTDNFQLQQQGGQGGGYTLNFVNNPKK